MEQENVTNNIIAEKNVITIFSQSKTNLHESEIIENNLQNDESNDINIQNIDNFSINQRSITSPNENIHSKGMSYFLFYSFTML